jgi:starch synthase
MAAKRTTAKRTAPAPLRVLFVAAECVPYAKTGGLGDVVAGLAKALRQLGHDARIVIPLYQQIDRVKHHIAPAGTACVHMGAGVEHWIGVQETLLDNEVPVWFVDFDAYFGRPGIYDGPTGQYLDNPYRFGLLCKAAMQLCKDRQFIPHVMHVHDWHTAITPVLLKTWDRFLSPLSATASVLTIHNIGYQGVYPPDVLPYLGLGPEHFTPDKLEDHGKINFLKAGIVFADALTTVSPTHAQEILTPEGGMGLAPFLNNRRADFVGILNGVDYAHWDPATDRHLPARYTAADLAGKAVCKAALQRQMGLDVNPRVPVFGSVSRFAPQKGFNLLRDALPRALDTMVMQFVVLGNGDPALDDFFRGLAASYPGRVGVHLGFHVELSHLIEAGSDFFLMPSLYEPCGLNQIYSLKYGSLPIVRATGGLDDTVQNYDERTGAGTGFKFIQPTAQALYDTIGWAVSTWYDRPHHIAQLRQQAMAQDFSWPKSAEKYLEVYRHAQHNRQTRP